MPKFHILSAAKYSFIASPHVTNCNMINKNTETGIGVQPKGQKSKTASHKFLTLPHSKMVILPPGISE